ncbi:hypothetical protein GLYMA_19G159800v4 [Glycine max]|nr:hypothetical protein GLYMA_19G159800v4 [Glycine max]KAH1078052.1 hypothetical protein GYH30_053215 [Glycine max]
MKLFRLEVRKGKSEAASMIYLWLESSRVLTLTRSCCDSLTPSYLGTHCRFFNNLKDTQGLKSKRRAVVEVQSSEFEAEINTLAGLILGFQ